MTQRQSSQSTPAGQLGGALSKSRQKQYANLMCQYYLTSGSTNTDKLTAVATEAIWLPVSMLGYPHMASFPEFMTLLRLLEPGQLRPWLLRTLLSDKCEWIVSCSPPSESQPHWGMNYGKRAETIMYKHHLMPNEFAQMTD